MSDDQTKADPVSTETESPHHLEQQRREKRDAIRALGFEPHGVRVDGITPLADAVGRYDEVADAKWNEAQAAKKADASFEMPDDPRPVVTVAGRVVLRRPTGKLVWMNLRDHSGDIQIAVSARDCTGGGGNGFELAKLLDLGDVVVATGPLMKTKTGEVTIWASDLQMGSKSLAPPPEKWSGLQDVEARYRKRYVDLYANPETMHSAQMRSRIVSFIRRWLSERGFLEVETPMLQTQAGGAAARPFRTHMNALGIDLYMRIAPELFLKRLLVGGMPRVFEINRNFRNEGLDKQHNPEFTMLELYQAFGDVESVMELTESLTRAAARFVAEQSGGNAMAMQYGDYTIDFESSFARVTYAELFEKGLGFASGDTARVKKEAEERGVARKFLKHLEIEGRGGASIDDVDPLLLVNELFEEFAEKSIDPGKPTWIMQYPAALSPLTRANRDNPQVADRSDLFIGHMEVGPHYTELNDPDVQAARFRDQLAGLDDEESTFRNFDSDFIEALKVGMPPAGGMGLGIDRLCMLLLNQRTIRDVILFPMMKPVE
ncbi:MAG: lysine--tRNA ligase [Phycisphaerales bacterium]